MLRYHHLYHLLAFVKLSVVVCILLKTQSFSHIFIVVFLTEFTSPYGLNTQGDGTPQKKKTISFSKNALFYYSI